jgi:hypothetical protein
MSQRVITKEKITKECIEPIVSKYLTEAGSMGFADDEEETPDEIEESTDAGGVGDFAYDAPAFGVDKETGNHKDLMRRSMPGEIRKESFEKTMKNILIELKLLTEGKSLVTQPFKEIVKNRQVLEDDLFVRNLKAIIKQTLNSPETKNDLILLGKLKDHLKRIMKETPLMYEKIPAIGEIINMIPQDKVGNTYSEKPRNAIKDMTTGKREKTDDYEDLVKKYSYTGGGDERGHGQTVMSPVKKIMERVYQYIGEFYKQLGFDFTTSYIGIFDGKRDRRSPYSFWEGMQNDFYGELGYDESTGTKKVGESRWDETAIQQLINEKDITNFIDGIEEITGETLTPDVLKHEANLFKQSVDSVPKKGGEEI